MTPGAAHAGIAVLVNGLAALLLCAPSAAAEPDLRQARTAGPLTVYPDNNRRNLFYYRPGDLRIATRENDAPDVHLLHVRYTGSVVNRDQGTTILRSIFTVRVVMNGPTPMELSAARTALAADLGGAIELRPLPIRRLESVIVYAPISPTAADRQPSPSTPMPPGHFEEGETAPSRDGYWTERVYTLGLGPEDAQLLSSALEHGQVALSIGYAFLADGIGPDQPLQELSGSPALVEALTKVIAPPASSATGGPDSRREQRPAHLVRAGAIAVTADLRRWPQLLRRLDVNEAAPPGYAALDVYCYDFNQGESPLYEKQIEIEAAGVGGPVTLTTSFSRSQPDIYARSLRFPVAVRLDRPYRFRVVEIAADGSSRTTAWRQQTSWTALLDVTAQGDHQ
jgi:hypothetical protein